MRQKDPSRPPPKLISLILSATFLVPLVGIMAWILLFPGKPAENTAPSSPSPPPTPPESAHAAPTAAQLAARRKADEEEKRRLVEKREADQAKLIQVLGDALASFGVSVLKVDDLTSERSPRIDLRLELPVPSQLHLSFAQCNLGRMLQLLHDHASDDLPYSFRKYTSQRGNRAQILKAIDSSTQPAITDNAPADRWFMILQIRPAFKSDAVLPAPLIMRDWLSRPAPQLTTEQLSQYLHKELAAFLLEAGQGIFTIQPLTTSGKSTQRLLVTWPPHPDPTYAERVYLCFHRLTADYASSHRNFPFVWKWTPLPPASSRPQSFEVALMTSNPDYPVPPESLWQKIATSLQEALPAPGTANPPNRH